MLDALAAVALSSPSKSDLQQRDILIVEDAAIRARINALLKDQEGIPGCPHLLVFLGTNRRQRQVPAWRGIPSPTTISTPSSTRRSMRPSRSKPSSQRQRRRASVATRSA
jgi:nitroreductase